MITMAAKLNARVLSDTELNATLSSQLCEDFDEQRCQVDTTKH